MTTAADTTARDRALVHQAAARLVPAHSENPNKNRAWYVLVGTNLYYVCDIVEAAFGLTARDVDKDRKMLDQLGFPVFALGYGPLMTKGHPAHWGE
ncbi:hypothetical protein AQF52_0263 [Streptomyces venezuelae]|uniref:hypothetical protein n=1 Tax=Streptomyces gardneri TaxID=66892 RepID=UPI0006BD794A|nr:hypothetical protein [Streptomyces gardneri]ALO05863.1 hypothetical protein AQF52_0263 [Streptomyces venezuelae]QPK43393.1 hypothetical protein H4W23_01250 [Streptomyces gardneri]WRK34617.1 hypothetical protein U0M97_01245 [Streptomyces venezuelae]CUM43922.1 hypothetical protein BN2537_16809 [Streptomyces venezuelae]